MGHFRVIGEKQFLPLALGVVASISQVSSR